MESNNKLNDNAIGSPSLLNFVETEERYDNLTGTSTTLNQRPNPLLNDVVVTNVVRLLDPSFEQLKTLRLVSKVWTNATLKPWRQSAVLTIVPDPSFFEKSKHKTGVPISEFLTKFQDPKFKLSGPLPFSKYKLKEFPININACMEPEEGAFKFWNVIGPLMKSVHFYNCKFITPGCEPMYNLARLVVGKIPNLIDLTLTDALVNYNHDRENVKVGSSNNYGSSDEDDSFGDDELSGHPYFLRTPTPEEIEEAERKSVIQKVPFSKLRTLTVYGSTVPDTSLRELLKLTPELEVIRGIDLSKDPMDADSLLQAIYQLRYDVDGPLRLPNLKTLDLINSSVFLNTFPWNGDYALKLATPAEGAPEGTQLPLETLTIHLESLKAEEALASGNLDKYLNSFSGTLKTLQVFRAPVGPPYVYQFLSSDVFMAALTELHLWGSITPNFEFLRRVPNLRKLKIDLACFEKRDVVRKIVRGRGWDYLNRKYENMEEDMALNVRKDLKEESLCAELEYLEIDFNFPEESLRLMGQWMPNLKTLKTILNEETVPVVCEVWRELTELVCLHGSKMGNSCFVRDEEEVGFLGGAVPKLKICDLIDLKRFQLDTYCGEGELTDDVVFKGFLKMTSLKSVEICVNSQMSEEAEQALKKGSIQFCKVVLNNPDYGGCKICAGGCTCERCAFRDEAEIYGLRDSDDECFNVYVENSDESDV